MINSEIVKRVIGLTIPEAQVVFKTYKCQYRIVSRKPGIGSRRVVTDLSDRNDDRYSLHMEAGKIAYVIAG